MRKIVIKVIGILWVIALAFVMLHMFAADKIEAFDNKKVDDSVVKVTEIKFSDVKTERSNYTGLLKEEIEDKLNKEGVFDFEIERLDKKDLEVINNIEDMDCINVSRAFHKMKSKEVDGIHDVYEYDVPMKKISGKKINLNGWDYLSITAIMYAINREEKKVGMTCIYTWYNMPVRRGYDIMSVYSDRNLVVNNYRAYAVYDYVNKEKVKIDEYNVDMKRENVDSAIYRENMLRVLTKKFKRCSNVTYVTSTESVGASRYYTKYRGMAGYNHQVRNMNSKADLYSYSFDINADTSFSGGSPQVVLEIGGENEV